MGRNLLWSFFLIASIGQPFETQRFGISEAQAETPNMLEALSDEISAIIDKVLPSLVVVEADFPQKGRDGSKFTVTGTGIVLSDRYVVANASLVEGKSALRIITEGKVTIDVELAGIDWLRGIAVLESAEHELSPIKPGNVGDLRPGNQLVVVGNSADILMASTVGTFNGFDELEGKLKIMASLTPGFSGGAVVNISGELVGILTGRSPEFISLGISSLRELGRSPLQADGYSDPSRSDSYRLRLPATNAVSAHPVDDVMAAIEQISEFGKIRYGFLGITPREIRRRIPNVYNTKLVQVVNVANDSPAKKSGIRKDDYIVLYDGKSVFSTYQLCYLVQATPPGETVDIALLRDDSLITVVVELGEMEGVAMRAPGFSVPASVSRLQSSLRQSVRDQATTPSTGRRRAKKLHTKMEMLNTQMRQLQDEMKRLNIEILSEQEDRQ